MERLIVVCSYCYDTPDHEKTVLCPRDHFWHTPTCPYVSEYLEESRSGAS